MHWTWLWLALAACGGGSAEEETEGFPCGEDSCVDGEACQKFYDADYNIVHEGCMAIPDACDSFDDLCFEDCVVDPGGELCDGAEYLGCGSIGNTDSVECSI